MFNFLKKILSFLIIFILISVSIFFISKRVEMNINNNILGENSLAIIGNSHPQTSINDSLLSQLTPFNVKNHSRSGQSMFWSIIGGKKLKFQGTKYFIIEITNSTYTTEWKTTDEQRGFRERDKRFFLEPSDWKHLFHKKPVFATKIFNTLHLPRTKLKGGFKKRKLVFTKNIVAENKIKSKENSFIPDFNDEIIHQFIKKNDSLFFIVLRVPQHPGYYTKENKENEKYYLKKISAFKNYKNCSVMDFGHKYKADSLFADFGHMNYNGSTVFSTFLADTISKIPKLFK